MALSQYEIERNVKMQVRVRFVCAHQAASMLSRSLVSFSQLSVMRMLVFLSCSREACAPAISPLASTH